MKKLKLLTCCFIATILLITMSYSASAGYAKYYPSGNMIQVCYEPNGVNFTWLDSQINNDSLLFNDGDVWYLNSTLYLYQSKFYINDTDVSKLVLGNKPNYGKLNFGQPIYINNIEITGGSEVGASGAFHDLYIHDAGGIRLDGIKEDVYNITIVNATSGLNFRNSNNIKIYNVSVTNTIGTAISCYNCDNTEVYDVFVKNAGDYLNPKTGTFAMIYWGGSEYSSAHDIFVNGTGWSSIEATDPTTHDIQFCNITVYNSGHNGLDLHGGYNYKVNNMTIYSSVSNNILSVGSQNVTLTNIYSYDAGSDRGLYVAENNHNFSLINYYSENAGEAFTCGSSNGAKIINTTSKNCAYGAQIVDLYGKVGSNVTIIDSKYIYSRIKDLWISAARNSRFVNANYTSVLYGNSNVEATFYYYADFIVKNSTGFLIPNATLSFTTPLKVNIQSVDAYGEDKSTFLTDSNGQTDLPDKDRKNSPVLAEKYKSSTMTYNNLFYTSTITNPDGRTISLSGITPDSSWYRKDPNIPTYTITAIIPDDSTDPHITGFAPSTENPFNPGETKNFRVWTDEPLTKMEWYVDGSELPVSEGSLTYAWPVTEGNHTIEFTGSNANGNVSKVWPLGGSSDEPSVPDDESVQEIEFSPADPVLTRNVSETVVFSVSPDSFVTKKWFVNGELVLNNSAPMSQTWDQAGTYNVTFSGSGSGETVLNTWTVNVVEEPKDEEQNKSIITIAPEYQIIEPNKPFDLGIKIEPKTSVTGTQLNFVFNSSMVSANGATEGDFFKQSGASTIFSGGTIDNSAGEVKYIYGLILGTSNVSSPGTMATVNLTAGNRTGMAEFSFSNVLISDASSKSTSYTVTNATVLIDTAPVMNPICCPKSVNEKIPLAFRVSAKDADCNSLTYSASGLPEGAGFNTTSGLFTWTPAVGQAEVYTFIFEVSDGYLTDSKNITVTVNKLNYLPVINFFEPLNGSFFSEGERINISVNASDADGQALNYSIKIDGVTCSTGPAYIWDTNYSSSGNSTIEVAVSNGINEVKEQHVIYINNYHPRWDVNQDGVVNILDITIIAQNYGTENKKPYPRWDVNQDGEVNIQDLTLVGYYFGEIVI